MILQRQSLLPWVLGGLLTVSVVLGGASGRGAGTIANGLLQLVSLVALVYAAWARGNVKLPASAGMLGWIALVFAALVALEMVPLPPALWQSLPGRGPIAAGFRLLSMALPNLPESLAGRWTVFSLLSLLTPCAVFLLVAKAGATERQVVPWIVLIAAVISLLLGVLQLVSGDQSPLRLYEITNNTRPVGFFANTNHLATLILMAIPLTGYLAARTVSRGSQRAVRSSGVIAAIWIALFLLVGLGVIGSTAGYGLAVPTLGAAILIFRRAAFGPIGVRWKLGILALTLGFVSFAIFGPISHEHVSQQVSAAPASRATFARTTLRAIHDSFPAGTGLGSFQEVYRTYQDPYLVDTEYVNHAHDDYLEFVLELGAVGIALLAAWFAWYARASWTAWRGEFPGANLARTGTVMIAVVVLHSLVDYPLRTGAVAAIAAAGCGLLVPPPVQRTARRKDRDHPAARHLVAA